MDAAKSAKDFSENLLNQGCKWKGMEVDQNAAKMGNGERKHFEELRMRISKIV